MDEQDFQSEIVANPDAVPPRLVYADWLSEIGDPRGEFIQVQCTLDKLDLRDPRRIDLEYRQRALLAKHRAVWSKPLRDHTSVRKYSFRRGMIEHVSMSAQKFVAQADQIIAHCPLRSVHLTKSAAAIAQWEGAKNLTRLRLELNRIGSKGVAARARSPNLANLNVLDVRLNKVSDVGIQALIDSTTLNRLTELRVTHKYLETQTRFDESLKKKLIARYGRKVCQFD